MHPAKSVGIVMMLHHCNRPMTWALDHGGEPSYAMCPHIDGLVTMRILWRVYVMRYANA